jgi:hypothetical protein
VSGARLRRRKASEQVDRQRDRFLDDQRRGGAWEEHQRRRSRVRVRYGSELSYREADDEKEIFESDVSRDGQVILKYSRSGRSLNKHNQRDNETPWQHYGSRNGRHSSRIKQQERHDTDVRLLYEEEWPKLQNHDQKIQVLHHGDTARPQQALKQPTTHQQEEITVEHSGTDFKNFVSFYFTNVPEGISNVSLRKGFEVCGQWRAVWFCSFL